MYSIPASRATHKHANGWMTVLVLGVLALGLLSCLFVLVGFPAGAQITGSATTTPAPATSPVPAATDSTAGAVPAPPAALPVQATLPAPVAAPPQNTNAPLPARNALPLRRRLVPAYVLQTVPVAAPAAPASSQPSGADAAQLQSDLHAVRDQLNQSQEVLRQAAQAQRKNRNVSAIFLVVFAVIAALIVLQVYVQARGWDREAMHAREELEAVQKQLESVRSTGGEFRSALPALLQEIGDQPLSYQEEGTAFAPRGLAMVQDIDHLAYVGQGRVAFRDLPSPSEAAVYLNGLLLSAVAHLSRSDAWTAFSRLDQFFAQLSRFPDAVERLRIAQAYSYRALAAYQVLESQDKEPSWRRKAERAQLESLSRQAFADVAHSTSVDPEWKHAIYVEALLCGRFYLTEEPGESGPRSELVVRGLRRSVSLYKSLIDERAYRGPSRRNLIRALKQIAELTGEKSDFSDFGYALNAFPTDEELADEALAARQPNSQDRFLWQWMLGDEELFAQVDRLNLAEYRAFWVRMLDNKVHLRNWRADLAELQHANPAMKEWSIQLLQAEPPLSLSNAIHRRLERYDKSAPGA